MIYFHILFHDIMFLFIIISLSSYIYICILYTYIYIYIIYNIFENHNPSYSLGVFPDPVRSRACGRCRSPATACIPRRARQRSGGLCCGCFAEEDGRNIWKNGIGWQGWMVWFYIGFIWYDYMLKIWLNMVKHGFIMDTHGVVSDCLRLFRMNMAEYDHSWKSSNGIIPTTTSNALIWLRVVFLIINDSDFGHINYHQLPKPPIFSNFNFRKYFTRNLIAILKNSHE